MRTATKVIITAATVTGLAIVIIGSTAEPSLTALAVSLLTGINAGAIVNALWG